MKIKLPSIKIPYLLGMMGGYGFDLYIMYCQEKSFLFHQFGVQKFCATTQFELHKVHSVFKSPYTLEEGLDKTLEHEFINKKEDDVLFYSE